MISFLCIFAVSFFAINLFCVVECLKRIADALEDFVYDEEEESCDTHDEAVAK
jgi:hypothetical protein